MKCCYLHSAWPYHLCNVSNKHDTLPQCESDLLSFCCLNWRILQATMGTHQSQRFTGSFDSGIRPNIFISSSIDPLSEGFTTSKHFLRNMKCMYWYSNHENVFDNASSLWCLPTPCSLGYVNYSRRAKLVSLASSHKAPMEDQDSIVDKIPERLPEKRKTCRALTYIRKPKAFSR